MIFAFLKLTHTTDNFKHNRTLIKVSDLHTVLTWYMVKHVACHTFPLGWDGNIQGTCSFPLPLEIIKPLLSEDCVTGVKGQEQGWIILVQSLHKENPKNRRSNIYTTRNKKEIQQIIALPLIEQVTLKLFSTPFRLFVQHNSISAALITCPRAPSVL